ncbi:MAG TPA: hypothetical protein P5531_14765 [Bacteroidales bacterium]|nr:hypothetical protein [Bacteroidales bacterium]HSA44868.1 hypothetical protein [Bacteroidales bacterium]
MKKTRALFYVLLLPAFLPGIVMDAASQVLEGFTAEQQQNKVRLSFTIQAGNTCNGIRVERSADGLFFEQIGSFEGVCGDLTFPEQYVFSDSFPLPGIVSYYRLDMGSLGFSPVISLIFIPYGEDGLGLVNKTVDRQLTVYLPTGLKAGNAGAFLFDLGGRLVASARNAGNSMFRFSTVGLKPAIYLLDLHLPENGVQFRRKVWLP